MPGIVCAIRGGPASKPTIIRALTLAQENVSDEIIQLCQETQADYVILGNPKGEPETNAFTRERLNTFAQHIEEASGAKAILVEEDQT